MLWPECVNDDPRSSEIADARCDNRHHCTDRELARHSRLTDKSSATPNENNRQPTALRQITSILGVGFSAWLGGVVIWSIWWHVLEELVYVFLIFLLRLVQWAANTA